MCWAMKPTTYMNLSGEAVREAAAFYKIPPERVLVVCDDISLPVGKLRLRRHGQRRRPQRPEIYYRSAPQRPVPPSEDRRGCANPPDYDLANWVLGHFSPEDAKIMDETADRAL